MLIVFLSNLNWVQDVVYICHDFWFRFIMEAKLEMTAFDLLEHSYSVGNITENTLQNQSTDSDFVRIVNGF